MGRPLDTCLIYLCLQGCNAFLAEIQANERAPCMNHASWYWLNWSFWAVIAKLACFKACLTLWKKEKLVACIQGWAVLSTGQLQLIISC